MRARHVFAGWVLLLAAGCIHTRTTGKDDAQSGTSQQGTEAQARAKKVTPRTPPGHPPLAASPGELMKPGSQEKVARALVSKGALDREDARGEALAAGIRRFQKSQGLAETGFPDHETLMRLGIDPKEVDRSLDNFSGSRPGDAQADVGGGKEGSGTGGSGKNGR